MNNFTSSLSRYYLSEIKIPVLLFLGLCLFSCSQPKEQGRRYGLKGKVISVDRQHRQVFIDHEEVTGLMEAMAMQFTLKDEEALKIIESGDQIQATLVVADSGVWLENPIITGGTANIANNAAGTGSLEPAVGAEIPDVSLINQDGKRLQLQKYRGRALLVTFLYTRCPLPDYCPLISTKFAEINRELQQDSSLAPKVHLLSVTLDPAYDTPKVLRSYGAAHTEKYSDEKFDTWEFATGDAAEIRRLAQFFGLTYDTEKDQIVHSLRTAIVTPDGKLYKLYHGNDWKPEDVSRDLRALVTSDAAPNSNSH